jgi:Insect cuticle protein
MFKFIVVIACIQLTLARPQDAVPSTTAATILEYTVQDDGTGNFDFSFKSSDGIQENASGSLKDINVPKYDEQGRKIGDELARGLVQKGSYSYTAPDGQVIQGKNDN